MKSFLKTLFVLIGVSSLAFIIYQQTIFLDTPGKIFAKKFETDIEFMQQIGHLPQMWTSLKEVKFVTTSKGAENWLSQARPQISTTPDGKYILEYVLIDDSEPEKQKTVAMVQMSIMEAESGNKIWELARVYSLDDDDLDNDN
jgi:hypothetical protein